MQKLKYLGAPNIERLLQAFRCGKPDRVPNFEFFIGKRNVEYILGKRATNTWKLNPVDYVTLAKKIGMDAIGTTVFNLLKEGTGLPPIPQVGHGGKIKNWDCLRKLERNIKPAELDQEKLSNYFRAVKGTNIGVWIHFTGGLTWTYEQMGFENFCLALHDDINFVQYMVNLMVEQNTMLLQKILEYDISFVHIGDDLGYRSGLLINPETLNKIWVPQVRKMLQLIKEREIPVTFHSDGTIMKILPTLIELGFCALNPIEPYGNDIYTLKQRYGDKLCLIGNIDVGILTFGTPRQVEDEVRRHIDRLAPGGGYVAATSHSVIDDIPPENFITMIKAIHKYGKY